MDNEAHIKRWQFVRSETLALLESLSDEQLQFKPAGEKWQPLFYEFGCMARTQLVYADAVDTGRMNFSLFSSTELPAKDLCQTKSEIVAFLNESNDAWLAALAQRPDGVDWPDGHKPAGVHIMALAEHERLHHGQLISYFTLAGYELPVGFKQTWAL